VQVHVESPNPDLSGAVINAVVASYASHLGGRHRKTISDLVDFFQEARDTVLPQLNELEATYSEFRASAPLEWSSSGEAVNPFRQDALAIEESLRRVRSETRQIDSKLRLIDDALRDQKSASLALRTLQFLLEDSGSIAPGEVGGMKVVQESDRELEIQERLAPMVIRLELLKRQYADKHPVVSELEEEIAATERVLAGLEASRNERITDPSLFSEYREEEARRIIDSFTEGLGRKRLLLLEDSTELETRLTEMRSRAHDLMRFENENISFNRRIKRLQDMLDSFEAQVERASLPLMNPGLEVEVLNRSGRGVQTGPNLSRSLMMGLMVSVALGFALVWLADWSEQTYRNPEEVVTALGLPILAHLPVIAEAKAKRKKQKKVDAGGSEELGKISEKVSVVWNSSSPISEAFRGIRTTLLCTRTERPDFQVIQITSSVPGEGKSTVAANLAASIAKAQKRVIVIDADLRRPTQHILFGRGSQSEGGIGLTSVMNYDVSLAEAIQSTSVEGLDVLTTGPIPNNPAEALMLPEFGQIIDELRMEYDLIVIDSPPMLACTDAGTISSTIADGVLFVMRIQRNIKPYSERSLAILKSFRVNLIGVVINAVGDSRYSSTYAASWSTQYGVYGSQYYYGRYGRYGGYRGYGYSGYLDDATKRTVTVQGMGRTNPQTSGRTPIAGAYANGVAAAERNGGAAVDRDAVEHPVATNGHAPAHHSGPKGGSENGGHVDE